MLLHLELYIKRSFIAVLTVYKLQKKDNKLLSSTNLLLKGCNFKKHGITIFSSQETRNLCHTLFASTNPTLKNETSKHGTFFPRN